MSRILSSDEQTPLYADEPSIDWSASPKGHAINRIEELEELLASERVRAARSESTLDEALKELEKIGWPCRLEELPGLYSKQAFLLAEAAELVAHQKSLESCPECGTRQIVCSLVRCPKCRPDEPEEDYG